MAGLWQYATASDAEGGFYDGVASAAIDNDGDLTSIADAEANAFTAEATA